MNTSQVNYYRIATSTKMITSESPQALPNVHIITTSSIPHMAGPSFTSSNRATLFAERGHQTTIWYPYFESKTDQHSVYRSTNIYFHGENDLRKYIKEHQYHHEKVQIRFYSASLWAQHHMLPSKNLIRDIPESTRKHCWLILEEPEHLLTNQILYLYEYKQFQRTIGIIHTNYAGLFASIVPSIIKNAVSAAVRWFIGKLMSYAGIQVLAISPSLSQIPKSKVLPIHGVREDYYNCLHNQKTMYYDTQFYYCGQIYNGFKNLYRMVDLVNYAKISKIDMYGTGPEEEEMALKAYDKNNVTNLCGTISDTYFRLLPYKAYISTSLLEGLCTATAEAIVMNKFVIIARHISNELFYHFNNVLTYDIDKPDEFVNCIKAAQMNQPRPDALDKLKQFRWSICNQVLYKELVQQ